MPIWHQSPKLTPRYFLETPRLFGYPQKPIPFRKDIGFLLYIGNFRNEIVFFCIF